MNRNGHNGRPFNYKLSLVDNRSEKAATGNGRRTDWVDMTGSASGYPSNDGQLNRNIRCDRLRAKKVYMVVTAINANEYLGTVANKEYFRAGKNHKYSLRDDRLEDTFESK